MSIKDVIIRRLIFKAVISPIEQEDHLASLDSLVVYSPKIISFPPSL